MKKSITLGFWLLAFSFSFSQTIRRVNNNAGVTGVNIYTTIQAAHDAATAGDIVYVEPSTNSTGNLTATKTLTYIGNGYFIPNNSSANAPADTRTSLISSVTLNTGSANSIFQGLEISGVTVNVPNVVFDRCRLTYSPSSITLASIGNPATSISDNVVVKNCYLSGAISGNSVSVASGISRNPSGLLVRNCILTNASYYAIQGVENSVVSNNTIVFGISASTRNTIFLNNLILSTSLNPIFGDASLTSCAFQNNITFDNDYLPTGNGNQNGVSSSGFLIGAIPSNGIDKEYQLSATSPGLTMGLGGTQIGAFGGLEPYLLSGLPRVPIITLNNNSGVGNATTPLQVNTITRGNN